MFDFPRRRQAHFSVINGEIAFLLLRFLRKRLVLLGQFQFPLLLVTSGQSVVDGPARTQGSQCDFQIGNGRAVLAHLRVNLAPCFQEASAARLPGEGFVHQGNCPLQFSGA